MLNPWTSFRSEKIVLCRVDEGIELCKTVLCEKMVKSLEEPFILSED